MSSKKNHVMPMAMVSRPAWKKLTSMSHRNWSESFSESSVPWSMNLESRSFSMDFVAGFRHLLAAFLNDGHYEVSDVGN